MQQALKKRVNFFVLEDNLLKHLKHNKIDSMKKKTRPFYKMFSSITQNNDHHRNHKNLSETTNSEYKPN